MTALVEGYCGVCRKMVPLAPPGKFLRFRLAPHYTFMAVNHRTDSDAQPCTGVTAIMDITHGMDDPKAALG